MSEHHPALLADLWEYPAMSWVVAVLAAIVTATLGGLTARRAAYERVNAVLGIIGEGPVAGARHRMGALYYDHLDAIRSGAVIVPDDVELGSRRIDDIFVVLWGATRVNAVRRSLGPRSLAGPPYKLLRDSMSGWVRFWMGPVEGATHTEMPMIQLLAQAIGVKLDPDDVWGLIGLVDAWRLTNTLPSEESELARPGA